MGTRCKMAYRLAVLVALVAAASAASITKNEVGDEAIPGFVRVFEDLQPAHGVYKDFFTYEADLSKVGWDNKILSYCITGIWMFYNHVNYNADAEDWMFWTHGIDFCDNVPSSEEMMASSFRWSEATENWTTTAARFTKRRVSRARNCSCSTACLT